MQYLYKRKEVPDNADNALQVSDNSDDDGDVLYIATESPKEDRKRKPTEETEDCDVPQKKKKKKKKKKSSNRKKE